MNALYITSKPIFPAVDGGNVASRSFLNCLLEIGIHVKHLNISTAKHPFNLNQYPKNIQEKTAPESVFIDTKVRPIPALKHLFNKGSYNVNRFHSVEMEHLIEETLASIDFDAIILDSLYTTSYIKLIKKHTKAHIFLRSHNVESDIWNEFSRNTPGLKGRYLKQLSTDLRIYEREVAKNLSGIFSISKDDSLRFKELGINCPIYLIPVALENNCPKRANYDNALLYHIGSMDWEPNQEAVKSLVDMMPDIHTNLCIAGHKALEHCSDFKSAKINVHGFVDDLNEFAIKHGILASPIQSGSGIRIKILDAMSIGIPVITTSVGALGIDHESSHCLIVKNSSSEMIDSINELVESKEKRQKLGEKAIDYINKNHNIGKISQQLFEILKST